MIASLITFCSFILLSSSFTKHTGMQCWGAGGNSDSDIERDYVGTADECKAHCVELDGCVGFVRVITGSQYAGKCFFRSGPLGDPFPYFTDTRDCYVNDGCAEVGASYSPAHSCACKETCSGQYCRAIGVVEFSLTGAVTGAGRCDVAGTSCCCSCRDCVPFYGYL
eukprot:16120_1